MPTDPRPLTLDVLDHDQLVVLAYEALLAGHLIDRAGMPQLIARFGIEPMTDIAIEEWRGASPVYTRRTQALLGFAGRTDVASAFKGMQLDIGAPPQFMDFRYAVHDDHHGEFHLAHCGALMDVEPMGEDFVVAMCHAIEDPTFPATACATNPRAVMHPIHRPPRVPADRRPHCHWAVEVDDATVPAEEPAAAERVARTRAAQLPIAAIVDEPGAVGATDYAGELVEDLVFRDFSPGTLRAIIAEVALQGHLLAISFLQELDARYDASAADDIGRRQLAGVGGITAERLRRAFDLGDDLVALASVLELHPAFHPRAYVGLSTTVDAAGGRVLVRLAPCPALDEDEVRPWPALLAGDTEALEAIAWGVNPAATVRVLDPADAGPAPDGSAPVAAWEIAIGSEPLPEPEAVVLTRFSTGAAFELTYR